MCQLWGAAVKKGEKAGQGQAQNPDTRSNSSTLFRITQTLLGKLYPEFSIKQLPQVLTEWETNWAIGLHHKQEHFHHFQSLHINWGLYVSILTEIF